MSDPSESQDASKRTSIIKVLYAFSVDMYCIFAVAAKPVKPPKPQSVLRSNPVPQLNASKEGKCF